MIGYFERDLKASVSGLRFAVPPDGQLNFSGKPIMAVYINIRGISVRCAASDSRCSLDGLNAAARIILTFPGSAAVCR